MLEEIFNIETFNIVSDNEYYYFFRALNNGDRADIQSGITYNNGLQKLRTDRERFIGNPMYDENSEMSLGEVYNHIKMHHRYDTNCISLTSNANVGIMYGREYYDDSYILVKVPKNKLGDNTVVAGLYMLQEIQNVLDEYIKNTELDDITKYYLDLIDNIQTQEQLDALNSKFKEDIYDDSMFERGINFYRDVSGSSDYSALNPKQNLEKNKLIAKINVLGKQILPNVSNRFLIQTIGLAFSSTELIHYKEINKEEIIECPKEIMDIFAILQQTSNPLATELKLKLIKYLENPNYIEEFKYDSFTLDTEKFNMEYFYNITQGGIDYNTLSNLYNKTYYLAKSKLRAINSLVLLNKIIGNDIKYRDLLNELLNNAYGVELKIFVKSRIEKIDLSESVGLDISSDERYIFDYVKNLKIDDLENIMNNTYSLDKLLDKNIQQNKMSKQKWFANAIIDNYDWKKLNIKSIEYKQRQDLVNKLIGCNCVDVYSKLKELGIKESDISNVLLTTIIKGKDIDINNIDLEDTFSIDKIESFLGYYKLKDYNINLRGYQATTVKRIDYSYKKHKYINAILPTGGGKSFVALTEMLKFKDKEIFYLAPNDVILNQIEDYIVEYIHGKGGTFGVKDKRQIIKEVFPNLTLCTYSSLNSQNQEKIINHKYDLIIMDELHRTGAPEWFGKLKELFNYQDDNVKVLGITATPTRDCDGMDMADYWAEYFGYTKQEINKHRHLAINMDIYEAAKLGYVVNPKVFSCAYYLLRENGDLDELSEQINYVTGEFQKEELQKKYEVLRRQVEQADGVKKILNDNLRKGKRYIVFCPVVNQNGQVVEDEDGNLLDSKITGIDVIKKYEQLLIEYLGKENIECYSMLGAYSKSKNRRQLQLFEQGNKEKITFMIVMDKLNEGSHAKNDGLIWFRAIDENSSILCSQQFGRIIYALEPGQKMADEDRPIAIDLTNNLLRVKANKDKSTSKADDLDKLKIVVGWIEEYNKIPDINSNNTIESRFASILKHIQKKYSKYHDSKNFLSLDESQKDNILEILELGNNIDLWNIYIPNKIKKNKQNKKESSNDIFELTGILKDFYDLNQEVEVNIKPLTLEENVEEIYAIYETTGRMPNTRCKEKFSNGTTIGPWLKTKKRQQEIKELANNGNEQAKTIVEKIGLQDSTEKLVEEIYGIYKQTGKMPNTQCQEKFSNGTKIGIWLSTKKRQQEIIELATKGNEHAKTIVDKLGLQDSIEKRVEEIYGIYKQTGKMPNTYCKEKFSNGTVIGNWLNQKKNQKKIIELATKGNEHAKIIVEKIGLQDSLEKIVEEIYSIYKSIGQMPKTQCQAKFSNGTIMGSWLSRKNNRKKIIELATKGNEHAKTIVEKLGWQDSPEKFVEEIYSIYKSTGKMPNTNSQKRFNNGTKIGRWLSQKKRQEEIIDLATNGNKQAKTIVDELGLREKKVDLSLEQMVEEIYVIYETTGRMPNTNCKEEFSNGTIIGPWLIQKKRQEAIIDLATKGNKQAKTIVDELGLLEKKVDLSLEQMVEEIYVIYETTGKMPNTNCQEEFSNSSIIGIWLDRKKNQKKLIELATKGNEHARIIVENSSWSKKCLIKLASINLYALTICLSKGWILDKDAKNYPIYEELAKKKKIYYK